MLCLFVSFFNTLIDEYSCFFTLLGILSNVSCSYTFLRLIYKFMSMADERKFRKQFQTDEIYTVLN